MTQAQTAVAPAGAAESSVGNELERLVASARDALTDDMVTRLSATASEGLDLLDRVNRSGIVKALPAIAQLVENGDLERLVSLARLIAAIEDSLSDDIVHRLAIVASGLASLVDRLARNEGFAQLIDLLSQENVHRALVDVMAAAAEVGTKLKGKRAHVGGVAGLWRVMREPGTQNVLRFMSAIGERMNRQ